MRASTQQDTYPNTNSIFAIFVLQNSDTVPFIKVFRQGHDGLPHVEEGVLVKRERILPEGPCLHILHGFSRVRTSHRFIHRFGVIGGPDRQRGWVERRLLHDLCECLRRVEGRAELSVHRRFRQPCIRREPHPHRRQEPQFILP